MASPAPCNQSLVVSGLITAGSMVLIGYGIYSMYLHGKVRQRHPHDRILEELDSEAPRYVMLIVGSLTFLLLIITVWYPYLRSLKGNKSAAGDAAVVAPPPVSSADVKAITIPEAPITRM